MATGIVTSLGGSSIKQPTDLEIQRFNITHADRTAKGKMVMDLIAKKRKFLFSYNVISGAEYDKILGVIDSDAMFFNISYIENGSSKSATVYVGPISAKKYRTNDNGWYWKDVTFDLIEQ
jgi:DNA-directed RNA polymerase alpha subunit